MYARFILIRERSIRTQKEKKLKEGRIARVFYRFREKRLYPQKYALEWKRMKMNPEEIRKRCLRARKKTNIRRLLLRTRRDDTRCIRHARLRYATPPDEIFQMNHSLPASTTTTVRLYALTHLYTHTPYYAIRNRSEMFDLSRSFLAQIAAEQKKVWFLYGFSVMFIGGIYRIKRNWKDTTTKNGSFIIYWLHGGKVRITHSNCICFLQQQEG
jgi:hypothetical protein